MYPYCDFCRNNFSDTCELSNFQPYVVSVERYIDLRQKLLKNDVNQILGIVKKTKHLKLFPVKYQLCLQCLKQYLKYRVKHIYLVPDTFTIKTYIVNTDTNDYEYFTGPEDSDSGLCNCCE